MSILLFVVYDLDYFYLLDIISCHIVVSLCVTCLIPGNSFVVVFVFIVTRRSAVQSFVDAFLSQAAGCSL